MEAIQDEYVTRHLPDGRIIYTDHRIAFVAGYLTEEVMGMSAFNFIHQDDLPWATVANRQSTLLTNQQLQVIEVEKVVHLKLIQHTLGVCECGVSMQHFFAIVIIINFNCYDDSYRHWIQWWLCFSVFSSVEGQGYSVYRLRSKTGTLIYLRTRGYLEFNKTTQKVESFVCINTLLT